jgi:Fe2+ or Zn2+ uptake regulation protein
MNAIKKITPENSARMVEAYKELTGVEVKDVQVILRGIAPSMEAINVEFGNEYATMPYKYFDKSLAIATLLQAEKIFFNTPHWRRNNPEDVIICVKCNDIFDLSSADSQICELGQIHDLFNHYTMDTTWGTIVWCIKQRRKMPLKYIVELIENSNQCKWNLGMMDLN